MFLLHTHAKYHKVWLKGIRNCTGTVFSRRSVLQLLSDDVAVGSTCAGCIHRFQTSASVLPRISSRFLVPCFCLQMVWVCLRKESLFSFANLQQDLSYWATGLQGHLSQSVTLWFTAMWLSHLNCLTNFLFTALLGLQGWTCSRTKSMIQTLCFTVTLFLS